MMRSHGRMRSLRMNEFGQPKRTQAFPTRIAKRDQVENFDFSRASFAQPVAEGDDFEDAFYPAA